MKPEPWDCPHCGRRLSPFHARDGIHRCRACAIAFQRPLPTASELAEIYGRGYYDAWGDQDAYWDMKLALYLSLLRLAPPATAGGAALDVGCATGAGTAALRACGFAAWGVDRNAAAIDVARRRVPEARFTCGTLESASYPPQHFDCILLCDFIEHLDETRGLFAELNRILKPGAHLIILTPDLHSISARVMGRRWLHFKREHLAYYTRPALKRLLTASGLTPVRMRAHGKPVHLAYAHAQMRHYPIPILSPLLRLAVAMVPRPLRERAFPVPMGELAVLARKSLGARP